MLVCVRVRLMGCVGELLSYVSGLVRLNIYVRVCVCVCVLRTQSSLRHVNVQCCCFLFDCGEKTHVHTCVQVGCISNCVYVHLVTLCVSVSTFAVGARLCYDRVWYKFHRLSTMHCGVCVLFTLEGLCCSVFTQRTMKINTEPFINHYTPHDFTLYTVVYLSSDTIMNAYSLQLVHSRPNVQHGIWCPLKIAVVLLGEARDSGNH